MADREAFKKALAQFETKVDKLSSGGATDSEPEEHVKEALIQGLFFNQEATDYYECYNSRTDKKLQKLVQELINALVASTEGLGLAETLSWLDEETAPVEDSYHYLSPLESWSGLFTAYCDPAFAYDPPKPAALKKYIKSLDYSALRFTQEEITEVFKQVEG